MSLTAAASAATATIGLYLPYLGDSGLSPLTAIAAESDNDGILYSLQCDLSDEEDCPFPVEPFSLYEGPQTAFWAFEDVDDSFTSVDCTFPGSEHISCTLVSATPDSDDNLVTVTNYDVFSTADVDIATVIVTSGVDLLGVPTGAASGSLPVAPLNTASGSAAGTQLTATRVVTATATATATVKLQASGASTASAQTKVGDKVSATQSGAAASSSSTAKPSKNAALPQKGDAAGLGLFGVVGAALLAMAGF